MTTNDIQHAFQDDPLITQLRDAKPVLWRNDKLTTFEQAVSDVGLTLADVEAAQARLQRFAPYIEQVFPETAAAKGIIESAFYRTPKLQQALSESGTPIKGELYLKADNELPISGSIKARGGIYEVLQYAEALALEQGLIRETDDYRQLDSEECRQFFSQYSIAVGSTGNLGLSIGIMSAKLGFQAQVHMSADAKQWKKDKLRSHGVQVFEYEGDYGQAVENGRKLSEADPYGYFVDDENSKHLFVGYAVAGLRLKQQFEQAGIEISADRPLYVYLPCGVGGGPGGVAFGLKLAFGDDVHCIFAEPVQSPCMLLGVYTGLHDQISVQDIGLSNHTIADGLAVGRASGFVGHAMQRSLEAFYTVEDALLNELVRQVYQLEGLKLEPSACAGIAGLQHFAEVDNALHLVWATGGNMMPDEVFKAILQG
ncbi:D-serine ammonia-lyase [Psychrobacter sp. FDAARGOS_221]|uniref:D-serine ammonia-lyase n=1 Tax=Psychrobacter sp. FDAARGOS_221 TaxID=1975705 RepID=UPI000BB5625F|nr:D-serine ammonia-lyase [Psychrobacter sp. FDAARGOS_221]PNK61912.1 D-serine ammonia-lyase [Psychrobacter sp. FDAARGOS_221]